MTRKSRPARAGLRDGLVPALLQEAAPGLGPQRPAGRQVGLRRGVRGLPGLPGDRVHDQRPARRQAASRWRRAAGRARRRPSRRPSRSARRRPDRPRPRHGGAPPRASLRRSSVPSVAPFDDAGAGVDAVGIAAGRHNAPHQPAVTAGGMQDATGRLGHRGGRPARPTRRRRAAGRGTRPHRQRARAGPPPGARAPGGDRRRCAGRDSRRTPTGSSGA